MVRNRKLPRRRLPVENLEARILLANQVIWIEGENAATQNFGGSWLDTGIQADQLSPGVPGSTNGAWLSHTQPGQIGQISAQYNFNAPEAGTYRFWARVQTYGLESDTRYSYKLDSGPVTAINTADLSSGAPIDADYDGSNWSNRQIGWVYVGLLTLTAGTHQITISAANTYGPLTAAIDCLAMTNFSWAPGGPFKPNLNATPGAADWFAFTAGPDEFSTDSVFDLSYLNEDTAGSNGFVTRVGDHYEFSDQPGVPVKFWGIDANPVSDPAHIQAQARWYAKHGINIVRLAHLDGFFNPTRDAAGNMVINSAKLDQFDRFFAALKDNGIYMDWSMVWKFPIAPQDGYPTGLYNELVNSSGRETYGVVNFMPQLQQIRWKFVSMMLNHVNPYTGLKYANDPALAVVEVQNEDNAFFWTPLNTMATPDEYGNFAMPLHRAELQAQWQQWVKAKYSTNAALQAAWGSGFRTTSDNFGGPDGVDAMDMKLYAPWELLGSGLPAWESNQQARAADLVRFLGELQRGYYESRIQQIRDTGFQGVTVTTNWMVGENGNGGGSSARAANLWADQAGDAIDKHDYWQGNDGDWRIVTTDTDANGPNGTHDGSPGDIMGTMLRNPGQGLLQVGMYQVEDRPFNYSEWSATPPNWYQAEAAPLVAFYGMGLQGWDASFQFASDDYYYNNGYESGGFLSFYNSDTPVYMGQFPALAMAVRRGDITQGNSAAARRINLTNAFAAKDAFTASLPNNGWGGGTGSINTPNEILAVGRVTARVDDGQSASQKSNWTANWNSSTSLITSNTGELLWDYSRGLIQVMAERTQAIIGFAGPGTYDLPGFTLTVQTNYVDLIFTALDDQPLATSQHILVTAMSRTKQSGAQFSADGSRITAIGSEPLMMEPVQATITLKDGTVVSVDVLDVYGVPTGRQVAATGNTFTIDGRYATVYYQINRSNTVIDNTPPTVTTGSVPAVTWQNLGRKPYSFTLHYSDNVLLDADSIDGDEVQVTGPGGLLALQVVNKVVASNGKTADVTYSFVPPGGKWSIDDAGVYTIAVLADSFADDAGNANAAASLGAIPVTLPGAGAIAVLVPGTPNADVLSVTLTATGYSVGINGMSMSYAGSSVRSITVNGLAGNDRITINGEVYICEVSAGAGNDTIYGGSGDDLIRGDEDNDLITGNLGEDTLYGNFGNDSITGDDGADSIMGGLGADTLDGGLLNDSLYGGDQMDLIYGREGDDYIEGRGKADTIYGGAGNDTILGGAGSDSILGDDGDDRIWVGLHLAFADTVDGGAGNDTSDGDANDILRDVENVLA